jgi:putative hemolysin
MLEGESPVQTAIPALDRFSLPVPGLVTPKPAPDMFAGKPYGRIGSLEVRLARSPAEIAAAQEVRYRVFVDERGARVCGLATPDRRDSDRFDAVCDHLLVFDTALPGPDHRRIVGAYRLLTQEGAARAGGFYSDQEFELKRLISRNPGQRFLELGRSCVLPQYRSKRTIELLWQGIWAYVQEHGIGVMAGCASFQGTVPAAHAEALSYLAHFCRTGPEFDISAVPGRYASMDLMPAEAINARSAIARMPPLIKGYLRVGARIGDGCVIDRDFDTVDVFVVMPVREIRQRYISYYGGEQPGIAA